jgi:hypothetical protein
MARSAAPHQLSTAISAGLALTGLLLALAGVYAMTSIAVAISLLLQSRVFGVAGGDIAWLVPLSAAGLLFPSLDSVGKRRQSRLSLCPRPPEGGQDNAVASEAKPHPARHARRSEAEPR